MHTSMDQILHEGVGSMGVGGLAPMRRDIPRSYRQARQALRIQSTAAHPLGVTNHNQLGVHGLVSNPADFVQDWLAPLLDYDRQHDTELTSTLAAYLSHGGTYSDAAAALHIHRSTLRYRLHKIRELTRHDLTDPKSGSTSISPHASGGHPNNRL